MQPNAPARPVPYWIFGITNLPFGIAGGYVAVALPFFLRNANVNVQDILDVQALALFPAAWQFLWAPVLDLGIRRRAWLVLLSVAGGICLGATNLVPFPQLPIPFMTPIPLLYKILLVLGQALCGLVASCNGALVSTVLPENLRGKAAGWVNAANLGAATLGGGIIMTLSDASTLESLSTSPSLSLAKPLLLALAHICSTRTATIVLGLMIILTSLAALAISEPAPARDPILGHLKLMAVDVWRAVKSRKGWTGLLFCISPVGTVVLVNIFSGIGPDFHVSNAMVELLNGYAGGFIQAGGALVSGYIIDRVDRRTAYLVSGVLTAMCAFGMYVFGLNPTTYVVGCVTYMLIAGLAYTSFSAVVYEIVGTAGKTAATLYSVFPAVGNLAIMYSTVLDGRGQEHGGVPGLLKMDALLNTCGVVFLLWMLHYLRTRPEIKIPEDQGVTD